MKTEYPVSHSRRRHAVTALALFAALIVAGLAGSSAPAQDLDSRLDTKRAELERAHEREGVLSTTIERYSRRIDELRGEVATLRNREAELAEQLAAKQAELDAERHRLELVRERLRRSMEVLATRLVAIYKSDTPDVLTVLLESDGFDDLIERYEYLNRIESRDAQVVARVRVLRDQVKASVERIRAARDAIAAQKQELAQTRAELESQEAALGSAKAQKQKALSGVGVHIERLEGDIAGLEDQIQAELQAAQAEESAPPPTLPAGPVQGGSGGFIWPVNGPVTSGFGMRWGRLHAGIDISAPAGTPIRAAKAGTVAFSGVYGGYGNYTCINHGGGVSSCYAHQSSIAVGSGSVSQGQVIGTVGCTGSCFGDHLHFEIRVNGSPVDPMGYL